MIDAAVPRTYLDSAIVINAFESTDDQAAALQHVFVRFRAQNRRGVTSEFTLAELFGRPLSRNILVETGEFGRWGKKEGRAAKLPDAVHAVKAIDAGCRYSFTTDKRFLTPNGVIVLAPDEAGFKAVGDTLDA